MQKICFLFIILLLIIAQPTVVFANNDINQEETQKNATEFLNFLMSNFNNLQKQITNVTQKNLELEAKIEELQKQIVSNKEQIIALTQENLELKAKIEESQKQLVSNYAILQEQHSANKVELEKVKKDIIQTFNALIDKLLGQTN